MPSHFSFSLPLATPSSYHAVQGGMDELRVDVRESGKLALVDVGDHQLVWRGQHGLGACEKLVEVLCCFATLKETTRAKVSYFDLQTVKS